MALASSDTDVHLEQNFSMLPTENYESRVKSDPFIDDEGRYVACQRNSHKTPRD